MIRLFDVLFSAVGLILGAPLLLLLTFIGLLDTGSPLFRQVRVGRDQKPFTLWKFRTMRRDTASVATHLASRSSITRFGHFLRRTKLDELPQLWNVLRGDMSVVGPRPERPVFVEEFILDRTLEPALAERPLEGFRVIDPTCGSGHFLLGAFQRLLDHWQRSAPGMDARERVIKALAGVYGAAGAGLRRRRIVAFA